MEERIGEEARRKETEGRGRNKRRNGKRKEN
jgi:hypothetical protein